MDTFCNCKAFQWILRNPDVERWMSVMQDGWVMFVYIMLPPLDSGNHESAYQSGHLARSCFHFHITLANAQLERRTWLTGWVHIWLKPFETLAAYLTIISLNCLMRLIIFLCFCHIYWNRIRGSARNITTISIHHQPDYWKPCKNKE